MIWPASAMSISWRMVTACIEKGDGRALGVDLRPQIIRAADAADEIDPFARTWVVDAEDGSKDGVLQQADIKAGDRVCIGWKIEGQAEPMAAKIHRNLTGAGRRRRR